MNVIYWVDRICFFSLLRVLWACVWGRCCEIRYLHMSGQGRLFLKLFQALKLIRTSVLPITFDFSTMRKDGNSLRYVIERDLLRIRNGISAQMLSDLPPLFGCRQDKVLVYLEKRLAQTIDETVRLFHIAMWYRQDDTNLRDLSHCIVQANRLNVCVRPFVEEQGFRLLGYAVFQNGNNGSSCLALMLFSWARLAKQVIQAFGQSGDRCPDAQKPKIAMEYVWGLDTTRRADLYWFANSGISPEQVMFYFQRPDRPITPEVLEAIDQLGVQPVFLEKWRPPARYFLKTFWLCIQPFGSLTKLFFRRNHSRFWLWCVLQRLHREVVYWDALFQAFNVRVHSSNTTVFSDSLVVRAIAIDRLDGIDFRSHYSHYPFVTAHDGKAHHVLFVWGNHFHIPFAYDGSQVDTLISCGYIFDHFFEPSRKRARDIRKQLIAKGADYIVCLFDSGFAGPDLHFSRDMLSEFYRKFFELLLSDSSLGLVLKPKRANVFKDFPELQEIVQQVMATKRCLVLDELVDGINVYMPCDASLSADIAVGFFINSAVIEAALTGVPGFHIDLTGHKTDWFYQWPADRVVFEDLDQGIEAVQQQRLGQLGLTADETAPAQFDPFKDGQGGQRVGQYLCSFLNMLSCGASRDDAMQQTNAHYAERWGKDKVKYHGS